MRRSPFLALGALILFATSAQAAPPDGARKDCFRSRDWQGWSAPGEGDFLLLRVGIAEVYRVDLIPRSHVRKYPDNFLTNRIRGSSWICSPLDLDLVLADRIGMRQPLFPTSIRKLTPQEIAAIPKADLPH